MNAIPDLFKVPGFSTGLLRKDDTADLQALLEKCADYSLMVSGASPGPNAAAAMLVDCPPGRTVKDKLVLGFSNENGRLAGVLDAVRDYPGQGDWWLGLLLLDPAQRNKGYGQSIVRSFDQWLHQQGAKRLFLGVVQENERGFRFWQTSGFKVTERQPARQFGERSQVVITMMKDLSESENDRD